MLSLRNQYCFSGFFVLLSLLMLKKIFNHRFGPVAIVAVLVCIISFITRIILLIISWQGLELNPLKLIGIFIIGLFYDAVVSGFFAIPVALYCWLMKDSFYKKSWNRIPLFILFFIITFILCSMPVAKLFFGMSLVCGIILLQ